MSSPLPGYDAWLSRPFEIAEQEAENYIKFCEENDIDPDSEDSEALYADYLEALWEEPEYDADEEADYEDGAYEPWDDDMNGEHEY